MSFIGRPVKEKLKEIVQETLDRLVAWVLPPQPVPVRVRARPRTRR